MAWVYILECRGGAFYVGSTRDLRLRLAQHLLGKGADFTRRRRPLTLAWAQEFSGADEAYLIEHQIKGWSRQKKIALIEGAYDWLHYLAGAGVNTNLGPISTETRRRIEADTAELLKSGRVPANDPSFQPRFQDAVTRQGSRPWKPRIQR